MREQIDELRRDYVVLSELLECTLLSLSTRSQLEAFRSELMRNISFLLKKVDERSANSPNGHPSPSTHLPHTNTSREPS
jgi:hypothetical protein